MKPPITILIPSFNNPQYLNPCVESIRQTGVLGGLCELIIINNGQQPVKEFVRDWPNTQVLEPGKNLGWEQGLAYGFEHTNAPFVVFQNDDTHIPRANAMFYHNLFAFFNDTSVAAVGPATTVAAGWHSIFQRYPLLTPTEVSYLIFFTVMIRREHYELAGKLDTSCPGGDDIDLSIRLRKAGKKLVVNPAAFLIHHGFKTGERVRGGPGTAGGWNSQEMQERTNKWLIQKHGFKTYMETMRGLTPVSGCPAIDSEGDLVRSMAKGGDVVELGCGAQKTISKSIGIDRVAKGELIPHVAKISVADIVADVSQSIPIADERFDIVIARHILEHCVDSIKTLREWSRILKPGGQLIVAVPNEHLGESIPLNPEHAHAFTPDSLKNLMALCGFKETRWGDPQNGISFVGSYEKVLRSVSTNGKVLEKVFV